MLLIKVPWYVLRVKTMHVKSPTNPGIGVHEERQSQTTNLDYIFRQGEAKLCILKLPSVVHHFLRIDPKKLCALALPSFHYYAKL